MAQRAAPSAEPYSISSIHPFVSGQELLAERCSASDPQLVGQVPRSSPQQILDIRHVRRLLDCSARCGRRVGGRGRTSDFRCAPAGLLPLPGCPACSGRSLLLAGLLQQRRQFRQDLLSHRLRLGRRIVPREARSSACRMRSAMRASGSSAWKLTRRAGSRLLCPSGRLVPPGSPCNSSRSSPSKLLVERRRLGGLRRLIGGGQSQQWQQAQAKQRDGGKRGLHGFFSNREEPIVQRLGLRAVGRRLLGDQIGIVLGPFCRRSYHIQRHLGQPPLSPTADRVLGLLVGGQTAVLRAPCFQLSRSPVQLLLAAISAT